MQLTTVETLASIAVMSIVTFFGATMLYMVLVQGVFG